MAVDKKNIYEDVQDIDLSEIRKKRFRIDGDSTRILELNTSDMGIVGRLEEELKTLKKLLSEKLEADDKKDLSPEDIAEIDQKMRESVDRIFDANVSEICAPFGTMADPIDGQLRYEHIIDVLTKLYENNMNAEFKRINDRIKKHTAKYTKKR